MIIPIETEKLFISAIEEAHHLESTLGSKTKYKKGKAELAFESLREGRIEIGDPNGYTYKIDPHDDFQLSHSMVADQERYAYYVIVEPILIFPKRGAQYKNLECQIEFVGPKDQSVSVLNIFPKSEWKTVLSWGGDLGVFLKEDFEWGLATEKLELITKKAKATASVGLVDKNSLSGFIQVHPFRYNLGRMDIEAQHSNSIAMWRFDSGFSIRKQKTVSLLVLLKIPKDIKEIQIEVAAQAIVSFEWLTAQLEHVLSGLSEALQNTLSKRNSIPLQKFESWKLRF